MLNSLKIKCYGKMIECIELNYNLLVFPILPMLLFYFWQLITLVTYRDIAVSLLKEEELSFFIGRNGQLQKNNALNPFDDITYDYIVITLTLTMPTIWKLIYIEMEKTIHVMSYMFFFVLWLIVSFRIILKLKRIRWYVLSSNIFYSYTIYMLLYSYDMKWTTLGIESPMYYSLPLVISMTHLIIWLLVFTIWYILRMQTKR